LLAQRTCYEPYALVVLHLTLIKIYDQINTSGERSIMNTKLKKLLLAGSALVLLAEQGYSQQGSVNYQFTPNAGVTISNAYIADFVPQEAYAFFTPVSSASGTVTLQGYGPDAQYIALFATFTDASDNTGLALALPGTATTGLAGTVIAADDTWAQFESAYSLTFVGSQSTLESQLTAQEIALLENDFSYVPSASPILNTAVYNNTPFALISGEIVGFDGAEGLGSLSLAPVPEPSALAVLVVGVLAVVGRWRIFPKLSE
jgi:hypothetical protein